MIYVGTSGFAYAEWKGIFYPDDLPQKEFLSFYSSRFKTTEINNTFYKIPSAKHTAAWAEQVPDGFRFAVKLSQRITHKKRLRDVSEEMEWFLDGVTPLREKLGCVLVQLPPWLRADHDLLDDFLLVYSRRVRLAVEFRHESWQTERTLELLQRHSVSLVVAETDDGTPWKEVTAPFLYLRLRAEDYSVEELKAWAAWLKTQDRESFVFFKHEKGAPALVESLDELLGQATSD